MTGRAVTARRRGPARGATFLCFAHRGSSVRAPENTLAAFEAAIKDGADAIEFDVRRTLDGVPVVLHDATLDRSTTGRGPLARTTLRELRRLDAGAWFDARFRGARVPTLAETLDLCRGRAGLNVEMKLDGLPGGRAGRTAEAQALAQAVAGVVAQSRFDGYLVVSSFDRKALEAFRARSRKALLGLLVSRSARAVGAVDRRVKLHAVHPHRRLASARRLRALHRRGLLAYVWGVDDTETIARLARDGADGVMTDDPLLVPKARAAPGA
ncbi:MAG TPA: glycerophosphodiester phosphodiesterase family protein [Candidatus Polarisedimenticolia bacterium]|nr:glycerophosphodiester phosphodiesterase family protein [Candidatus Polarisedimenticolia bacterium]